MCHCHCRGSDGWPATAAEATLLRSLCCPRRLPCRTVHALLLLATSMCAHVVLRLGGWHCQSEPPERKKSFSFRAAATFLGLARSPGNVLCSRKQEITVAKIHCSPDRSSSLILPGGSPSRSTCRSIYSWLVTWSGDVWVNLEPLDRFSKQAGRYKEPDER